MDSNPQSSGICQRLFRFILGGLRLPSNQVVVEEGPPPRLTTSEVMVEFRHASHEDHHQVTRIDKKRKGAKKSVTIMENKEAQAHHNHNHNHNHSGDHVLAPDDQLQDDTKTRRHWPLLSVASNINEKSEEFIEKKRKAMSRNYTLDQEHKK